jgi:hypothetical protein
VGALESAFEEAVSVQGILNQNPFPSKAELLKAAELQTDRQKEFQAEFYPPPTLEILTSRSEEARFGKKFRRPFATDAVC